MGIIKRGILGGFSNSVGNVVGSSWKGIATMKAKPLSVANPRTAGQVVQRDKMSNVVAFAKLILVSMIKPLNDRFAGQMSGFNLFVQRNLALFTDIFPNPAGDLILCEGSVTPAAGFMASGSSGTHEITYGYDNNAGSGDALAGDISFVIAYNENKNEVVTQSTRTRAQEGGAIPCPDTWGAGDLLKVYHAYRRADGSKVSNTSFSASVMG